MTSSGDAALPSWVKRNSAIVYPLAIGLLSFVLYLLTLYPGVGGRSQWGDAAKWQYLGSILGVSHPPGSPLYVLLSYVVSHLPIAPSIGTRVMIFSALCGATTNGVTFALCRRLGLSRTGCIVAVVALATSQAMWTFSTEAEVYALLTLAWVFVVDRLERWRQDRRTLDYALACGAYAVAFGVHYMMITFLPAFAFFVLATDARYVVRARSLAIVVASIALGLLPIVWLWFNIPHAPYSEFPNPRTWPKFVDFILGKQFHRGMFDYSARDLWSTRAGEIISLLGRQIGWVPLFLVPLGFDAIARKSGRTAIFLFLAIAFPLLFVMNYRAGDDLGGMPPTLIAVTIAFAAAVDAVLGRFSGGRERIGGRVVLAVLVLTMIPGIGFAAYDAIKSRPIDHLTHDLPERHEYRWDVACVVQGADDNAVIVSPWADYGARQVNFYYRYADATALRKHLRFAYTEEAHGEWTMWAKPEWTPQSSDNVPVYVFRKNQVAELEKKGFRSTELTFATFGECGAGRTERVYRLTRTP